MSTIGTRWRRGSDVVLDVLRTEGVGYVFGNPGTTELPLLTALACAPDIHYVLALQEATAVGMADGSAQVTGRPGVVNLHTVGGLANGIGNLANARATNVPMVVTAGQQDLRHLIGDPLLSGDLSALARPVAKWTHEARSRDEIATVLQRAFHDAVSPPAGPVFVSLPMNLLEEMGETEIPEQSTLDRSAVGGGLDRLADEILAVPPGRLAIILDAMLPSDLTYPAGGYCRGDRRAVVRRCLGDLKCLPDRPRLVGWRSANDCRRDSSETRQLRSCAGHRRKRVPDDSVQPWLTFTCQHRSAAAFG
jgi:glyoxylate carboligase